MKSHESLLYLPFTTFSPADRVRCPVCGHGFILANGYVHKAIYRMKGKEDWIGLAFMCSEICILNFVSTENMHSC